MGILEITLLRSKGSTKYTDPTLLFNLQSIRSQLGTNSRFFVRPTTDGSGSILILGTWPSLQAHNDFLISEDKNKTLELQEAQTFFIWTVHIDLGEGMGMEALPLDAWRAISVARMIIPEQEESALEALEEAYHEYLERVAKNSEGKFTKVLTDWRMDPKEGTKERIVIMSRDDLPRDKSSAGSGPGLKAGREIRPVMVAEDVGYDLENDATRRETIKTEIVTGH